MSDEAEKPDVGDAVCAPDAVAEAAGAGGAIDQSDIDALLNQAEQALSSLDESAGLPPGVQPFQFHDLASVAAAGEPATLDLVRDVQLDLKIELGRTHMHLEEVLRLKEGAVVTLDKLAGDPVDIYANGRLIARGEVLVLNDNFCVRVAELIADDAMA
jgi:flagellar motor switch protein FliN